MRIANTLDTLINSFVNMDKLESPFDDGSKNNHAKRNQISSDAPKAILPALSTAELLERLGNSACANRPVSDNQSLDDYLKEIQKP